MELHGKRKLIPYLFTLPWVIGFLLFFLFPLSFSLFMSFHDWPVSGARTFVGFQNYIDMFTKDETFWHSLKITLAFAGTLVPLNIIIALGMALLLNRKVKGENFFKTAFYIPSIISGVALAIIWSWILNEKGILNYILSIFHIEAIHWLRDPKTALFAVVLTTLWAQGNLMIVFLSGLKRIPKTVYEAATIDGAGPVRIFFKITLPLLTPTLLFNLIMAVINAFQQLTVVINLTKGGPDKATYMYSLYVYENAFKRFKMGYAAANAWVMFLIILLLTGLIFFTSKKWANYDLE